jgi:hypothetical protein
MTKSEAMAYVRRIRNPIKRAYAEAYLAWLERRRQDAPKVPHGLGYMAAQAVRLTLNTYNPYAIEVEVNEQ